MTEVTATPTHFRLLSALRAIGPYLRESDSKDGHYLFDCLSVCVDDKQSPEEREFWGWWLELDAGSLVDNQCSYVAKVKLGLYNKAGDWKASKVPKKAQEEVARTQRDFIVKLNKVLEERFELKLIFHKDSEELS